MNYTEGWADGYRSAKEDLLEQLEIAANDTEDLSIIDMYLTLIDSIESGKFLEIQVREEN
jgi:hypothetical protein